jgi:16S rRNA (cytosine1402-N4)-methyltransferase
VLDLIAPAPGQIIVDCTAGAGGHTAALARLVGPEGRVIGFDRDPAMLDLARQATEGLPVTLVHAPYDDLDEHLDDLGFPLVDALLADLGLSSDQLAWTDRGFSFSQDGPLDMRFDSSGGPSAADIVNTWSEERLADVFYEFGEERHSRRVARRIVADRRSKPFRTTAELAYAVRGSIPGKWGQIDPSTRVFQALRIAVNGELDRLDTLLDRAPDRLKPGGRIAIISFHSLEDRRVKNAFRSDDRLQVLTKKVVTASDEERAENPRSRSAKMRAALRCPTKDGPESSPSTRRRASRERP